MSNTTAAAPRHATTVRTPQRPRWLPSLGVALATLCLSAALAPQAFAAACGPAPALAVAANKWTMVGIPCVPVRILAGAPANVGNIFLGTNLIAANYYNGSNGAALTTWALWKRTYTNTGDSYTQMAVTDLVTTGGAYWLFARTAGSFQVNGTATPGPSFTTPALLSPSQDQPSGKNRYFLYTNPYASNPTTNPLNFSALLFSGLLFGAIATGDVSTATAISQGYISKDVSYWNGNTYFTRDNTNAPVATFAPNQAAWIKALPAAATITQTKIKANTP